MGELGGNGGIGAALDLLGGLGVEPGGTVELAGHGDSSRVAGAPATTRRLIVSRAGGASPPVHFRPTAETIGGNGFDGAGRARPIGGLATTADGPGGPAARRVRHDDRLFGYAGPCRRRL